jgi:very-short-patch-repair endonuclease
MDGPSQTKKFARTLRRAMSLPEMLLWKQLKRARLDGLRFRRQHPLGRYVLDFYCDAARLAIEVDGAQHTLPDHEEHDAARDAWVLEQGIETLRIPAIDVLQELDGVVRLIEERARRKVASGSGRRRTRRPP